MTDGRERPLRIESHLALSEDDVRPLAAALSHAALADRAVVRLRERNGGYEAQLSVEHRDQTSTVRVQASSIGRALDRLAQLIGLLRTDDAS